MSSDKRASSMEATVDPTRQNEPLAVPVPEPLAKKPTIRSNERNTADYLLNQNRIGQWNHQPLRKHRYVGFYTDRVCEQLVVLYTHFFMVHWTHFARAAEKFPLSGTQVRTHYEYCARVYITHWLSDLYVCIRKSLLQIDPIAFADRYHTEIGRHADRYDHYLSLLNAAIRPTHVVGCIADEVYIPIIDKKLDFTKKQPFSWTGAIQDYACFQLVHQTIEMRKLARMTNLSDDPMGRCTWLFDWHRTTQAFAWFPMEANYSETDVALAFILGCACSPKLGYADFDEWRLYPQATDLTRLQPADYIRVANRHWSGTSELRILQFDSVPAPNYYETDKTKHTALNVGPLALQTTTGTGTSTTSTSGTTTELEEEETLEGYVPESPRAVQTRSKAKEGTQTLPRSRAVDYCYYTQVIDRVDATTQFAAFKMILTPPLKD